MNKPPAFQLYAKDIYTGCSDLSAEEFGVYMRGLVWSWDNGPLPLDFSRRARILLIDRADLERIWPVVAPLWTLEKDGYINPRLEKQRQELAEFKEEQSRRGKRGADARWHGDSNAPANGASNAPAMPEALPAPAPKQCPDDGSSPALSDLHSPDLQSANSDLLVKGFCSEPAKIAVSEPAVMTAPTIGTGAQEWPLTQSRIDVWVDAYPGVDVPGECRRAIAWLHSNPTKRKTPKGMPRFLNAWIAESVNRNNRGQGFRGKETISERAIRSHTEFVATLPKDRPERPAATPPRPTRQIASGE